MYCHSQLSGSNIIIPVKLQMEASIVHFVMKILIIPYKRYGEITLGKTGYSWE
jgi:hypothetical protein